MIDKPLKKLTLCIENETKEDIVIIFAEPSKKDLEQLITEKCVLNLVTEILWTKKEKGEDEKGQAEEEKGKKGEDDWMEVWGRERRRRIVMEKISNNKSQDKGKESDEEAIDLGKDENIDHDDVEEKFDDKTQLKQELDLNIVVKAELSDDEVQIEKVENIVHTFDDNIAYDIPNLEDLDSDTLNGEKNKIKTKRKSADSKMLKRKKRAKTSLKKKAPKRMKLEEGEEVGEGKDYEGEEDMYQHFDQDSELSRKSNTNRYAEMEAKFSCERCDKRFRRKNDLTMHIANVHLKVKHHCDQCDAVLSSIISLKQHIRMKHSGLNETHVCNVCGKNFTHKQYLDKHLQTHENTEKNFVCKECGKCFGYKGSLKKHVQEHHENFFRYTCEECGQTFIDMLRYNMHMETTHQKGEKFTCNICGKEIVGKHRFKVHTSRHPKSLKYIPCSECGEEVPETHMRFHVAQAHKSENWKYKCPYCPRKMEKAAYIRIHIRSHTGAKPYICHGCNKGFTTRESIKKHIKDFHNDDKSLMFFDRSLDVDENFKIHK